jgi:predicted ribosome quality control (RQC) complex YloA/Tae2 family protein
LDRLFLRALVEELRPEVVGRRVRSAQLDRSSSQLVLTFAPPRAGTLLLSFLHEAPGLYLREAPREAGESVVTPALKKLGGSRIAAIEMAEVDRIVTLVFEGTRLSGKATASRLVLESIGPRADVYLIDGESGTVLEAVSSSRARLGAGERYHAPEPPPGAAPFAQSASDVEERLLRSALPRRKALLTATGSTPLAVREIEWLVSTTGASDGDAFMKVRSRLEKREPFLYLPPPGSKRHPLLSPFELASEEELEPKEHGSFSSAMAEAVSLVSEARKLSSLRTRIEGSLGKRLDRARRLEEKLLADRSSLEDPERLRRRGELLLAGLSRARKTKDGKSVVLTDLFDPGEREIEIDIDPRLPLPRNAERFFGLARKTERARKELEKRLEAVRKDLSFWEGFECDLRDASTLAELASLEREAVEEGLSIHRVGKPVKPPKPLKKERPPEALGPRSYRSHRGNAILVGRSGRSNDALTFEVAKPHDLWFHASGVPGAHVVLRVRPGETADDRELQEAAELAAYYSKAREESAVDVIVTERRNVSRIKGAPRGLVKLASGETTTLRVAPRPPA